MFYFPGAVNLDFNSVLLEYLMNRIYFEYHVSTALQAE